MKRFELYSPKTGVTITLEYGATLGTVSFGEAAKVDFWAFVIENMFTIEQMQATAKKFGYQVAEIGKPASFEAFWEAYDYKFDRKRAEDRWDKLSAADQAAAIAHIERYKSELKRTNAAQMYAKTYLINKVWS